MMPKVGFRTKAGLVLYLTVTVLFCSSQVSAKPVTFAYQTPTLNGVLPLIVGQDFGFFAAEGLDVKTVFIRGGPTAAAALVGGDVDYTFVAGVPAVRAIVQGAPLTIVSGIQPYMDYTLIGAKGIAQLNDLKGKIVGVTGAGGIAEYAAVEGLAKKGLTRDRDYKILYGVGNSPARAQALELGRIQASPFSFLERIELEQKGFPVLFDIGKVLPGFPFVVIISAKRKIETDAEGVTALLRGLKRGLDYLKSDKEKVAAAVIKKNTFGDAATIRKTVYQFADVYSLAITKEEVDALIVAARIEAEAKKFGGGEKFFAGALLNRALGQSR
jgi:ABC-type nitrate/sulfonate/bicarbonate transport system substrate-binding protein